MTVKYTNKDGEVFEGNPEEIVQIYRQINVNSILALKASTDTISMKEEARATVKSEPKIKLDVRASDKITSLEGFSKNLGIPLFHVQSKYLSILHLKYDDYKTPICGKSCPKGQKVESGAGVTNACGNCIISAKKIARKQAALATQNYVAGAEASTEAVGTVAQIVKLAAEKGYVMFLNGYSVLHLKPTRQAAPLCGFAKMKGANVNDAAGAEHGCKSCIRTARTPRMGEELMVNANS